MPVTFSGWQVVEGRKPLHGGEEPMGGHVYTMYHGTHIKNATTIITQGFQRSQDGLLGAGVYISRNKDKAKCYPLKVDKKDKVVFKLRVNVGKVKKIDCDNHPLQKSWHQNGYDCAWVPPKSNISSIKSGREEDCVWDPNNIKIVDVACCMDRAKCKDLRKLIKSQRMSGEECTYCLQDMGTGPHPIQNCWQCNKSICPFQRKHFCEQN
ncbi:grass carp reovirus (GCRV)-induced gene 2o [Anguilla rostrata]|uniref:grass carp reovirus (GCRV)-induced gene 2o n=1 Tax=Anguilla rostrata TaxID=7938 RepID=UPI0030D30C10